MRAHRPSLASLEAAFPLVPGQCGAVFAADGAACLDAVSRPDAFARLYPKLRAGYLLDAPGRLDRPATPVAGFMAAASAAVAVHSPSAGRGEDVRLSGKGVVGSGLELDGELLQVSAFTSEEDGVHPVGRIAQPSRPR